MHTQPDERRHFTRIAFDAQTRISQGPLHWSVKLLDVSLKGLLIEKPLDWRPGPDSVFSADIHLNDETHIIMDVRLAHAEAHKLGFASAIMPATYQKDKKLNNHEMSVHEIGNVQRLINWFN